MKFKRFIKSFIDAAHGIVYVFKNEQNFRIQVFLTIVALLLSAYFGLPSWQVLFVIFICVLVLTMELLNTALEHIMDIVKPRLHHYVMIIKDVMAAAVLLTSLGALLIGLIIFIPHFISLLK